MFDRSRRRLFMRRQQPDLPRLPWVVDEAIFTDQCTRCNQCVSHCETQIITQGDGGFPTVDFQRGECTFCYRCAEVCPEPLFRPQSDSPWDIVAAISTECLAQKKIECRSCGDMCETQAIGFKLQVGGVATPMIEAEACTGCGACVAVCPASAITLAVQDKEGE